MRRRNRGCRVVVCAAWIAALSVLVRAATVVPWQSAGMFDGEIVTVEGDVARAHLEADTCVLEFAPDDPKAFRVVLLIPLITDLPRQPQRLYEGKRVRVTGKIHTWKGRPEMIVRGPDVIEVVGVGAAAPRPPGEAPPPTPPSTGAPRGRRAPTTLPPETVPPPPTTPPATLPPPATSPPTLPAPQATTPAPPPVPPTTLAPVTRPATPTTVPPPPPPPAPSEPEREEPPRLPVRIDPCVAARERWQRAAGAADARASDLTRCLRAGGYHCRSVAAAIAPALSELEWAEQQVEAACP